MKHHHYIEIGHFLHKVALFQVLFVLMLTYAKKNLFPVMQQSEI